mgnify:CR=1 FL=1
MCSKKKYLKNGGKLKDYLLRFLKVNKSVLENSFDLVSSNLVYVIGESNCINSTLL